MPDSFADARTRVGWASAVAVLGLPTAAELTAGILLNSIITPDGLVGFEATTADVDTGALDSEYDTVGVGRDSFSGTMLRLKKQTTGDVTYTTLGAKGVFGFLVIRRDLAVTTAWLAGQLVEVYPAVTGRRRNNAPEKNSVRKYEVPIKIYAAPNIDAVVA